MLFESIASADCATAASHRAYLTPGPCEPPRGNLAWARPRVTSVPGGEQAKLMPLEVNLSLCLPHDALSVPVVRHICRFALDEVGVQESCLSDITLALTEACTNVLDHANDGVEYHVVISIDEARCAIRVKDAGGGFDHSNAGELVADGTAESGRGLRLISELVDRVQFTSKPEDGMIVHLEKELEFDGAHPVRRRLASP